MVQRLKEQIAGVANTHSKQPSSDRMNPELFKASRGIHAAHMLLGDICIRGSYTPSGISPANFLTRSVGQSGIIDYVYYVFLVNSLLWYDAARLAALACE